MKKKILFFFAGLLSLSYLGVQAKQLGQNPAIFATVVTSSVDAGVNFYWNCDSRLTGQTPQKAATGTTITTGVSVSTVPGVVNLAIRNNNIGINGAVSFATATAAGVNLDPSHGRVGFYYCNLEQSLGRPFWLVDAVPRLKFSGINAGNTTHNIDYMNLSTGTALTLNATRYVEISYSSSSTFGGFTGIKLYLDGVLTVSTQGVSGVEPASGTVHFDGFDGNAVDSIVDQILISTDPTKDLYSIRNNTSF